MTEKNQQPDPEDILEALEDLGDPFERWFRPYKKRYTHMDKQAMRILFNMGERREMDR